MLKAGVLFFVLILMYGGVIVSAELVVDSVALDEAEAEIESVEAGTTPDSTMWGVDVALDRMRYMFARDKERAGLKIAQERLEEIKIMSRQGKFEESERAAEKHKEIVERVKVRVVREATTSEDETDLDKMQLTNRVLTIHEDEFVNLKERFASLTPEQKEMLFSIIDSLQNVRIEVNDAEDSALVRIEQKTGKSRVELRDELTRLREDRHVKVELFDNFSVVKVDYRFEYRGAPGEIPYAEIIKRFALTSEQAEALLKIGSEHEDEAEDYFSKEEISASVTGMVSGSSSRADELEESDESSEVRASPADERENEREDEKDDEIEKENEEDGIEDKTEEEDESEDEKEDEGSWKTDGISLMLNKETGEYACFGCTVASANMPATCIDPVPSMELVIETEDLRCTSDGKLKREDYGSKEQAERLKIMIDKRIKEDEMRLDIRIRLRFVSSTDRAQIVSDIVERTQLTDEEVRAALETKERVKEEGTEQLAKRKVEVRAKTRDGLKLAEVRIEWEGKKEEYRLAEADKAAIVADIAARLGVSTSEVESVLSFEAR